MKKKKVIIIGTAWPYRGGLAAYNERLATEYQNQGCDVSIYTFTLQYPGFLFPGKTQMADWQEPGHLSIKRAVNSINPFNWLRVGNKIKKERPDLVIIKYWLPFMGPCFGTIARRIKKNRVSKLVSVLDNIIPHEKRIGDKLFTRYFIKPLDAFVAMSDSVLEDTKKFDTKKPRGLCPHPLFDNFGELVKKQEAKKYLGLDEKVKYILFFGFIRDYKGLDLLIEAFRDEKVQKLGVKLIIAGEFYSNEEKYLSLIEENKLTELMELRTDFIADEEVRYYFSAADLVVQPYKTATQSGISQIAYHFNKPMIVTDVGGLPEIVPDGKVGYVVKKDPGAIANAIYRFYFEKKEQIFTEGCKEEKEKYSWERMTLTINQLINLQ